MIKDATGRETGSQPVGLMPDNSQSRATQSDSPGPPSLDLRERPAMDLFRVEGRVPAGTARRWDDPRGAWIRVRGRSRDFGIDAGLRPNYSVRLVELVAQSAGRTRARRVVRSDLLRNGVLAPGHVRVAGR